MTILILLGLYIGLWLFVKVVLGIIAISSRNKN